MYLYLYLTKVINEVICGGHYPQPTVSFWITTRVQCCCHNEDGNCQTTEPAQTTPELSYRGKVHRVKEPPIVLKCIYKRATQKRKGPMQVKGPIIIIIIIIIELFIVA